MFDEDEITPFAIHDASNVYGSMETTRSKSANVSRHATVTYAYTQATREEVDASFQ